jgi:hypothetical protein
MPQIKLIHMKLHVFSIFFLAISLTLSGCFSLTNFQTARTVGKNKTELGLSINGMAGAAADADDDDLGIIPSIELGGKFGITEIMDVGIRLSNFGTFIGEFKYQFYGDKESMYAAATGISIGSNLRFLFTGFSFDIPLHFSVHTSEFFAFYFTPRYMGIVGALSGDFGQSLILSPGIEFGRKLKVLINYNQALPLNDIGLIGKGHGDVSQFGIGFKYKF